MGEPAAPGERQLLMDDDRWCQEGSWGVTLLTRSIEAVAKETISRGVYALWLTFFETRTLLFLLGSQLS
jgi:hypothetical protein